MELNKEYMVHICGGAWNHGANPSIEKDLGIKAGHHYFNTEDEKNRFLELLQNPIYKNQGIMTVVKYGHMSHKRTIFVGKYKYKEKMFKIHYDFGYEYEVERAVFNFLENDYSCDCNLSLFIRREYGDVIPELHCGHQIELLEYHIEYWD